VLEKIFIIGTTPGTSKSGVPAALDGHLRGFDELDIDVHFIESHNDNRNNFIVWFKAFLYILWVSIKWRKNAMFFFHGARWFSILRKSSLAFIPYCLGSKTSLHVHSIDFFHYLERRGIFRYLTMFLLIPFNKLFVLTPWWKNVLRDKGIDKKICISPNPCDKETAERALTHKKHGKQRTIDVVKILTLTRLIKGKGVESVILAMTQLPENYVLDIAGDGPLENSLKALVLENNLTKRVFFHGWVSGGDKRKLFEQASVFCLPSQHDSFGMVYLEAMSFGVPIVALDWGPISDVVTKDVGICSDSNDPIVLANVISSLAHSQGVYCAAGPKKIIENYLPRVVVKTLL